MKDEDIKNMFEKYGRFVDGKEYALLHCIETVLKNKGNASLEKLREVHAMQGRDGCWDIDDYMLGLFNGLELALSIMENRDVYYRDRKEKNT